MKGQVVRPNLNTTYLGVSGAILKHSLGIKYPYGFGWGKQYTS